MRQFTQVEYEEIAKAEDGLRQTGFDVDHEGANHNGNLVLQYFQANPTVPVTVASIYGYIEKNKAQFIWRSPAQREYDKVVAENPTAASAVANWLANQGSKPGQLVNSGDQAFENASSLITELRGRDVNPETIFQAIGRLTCRVGSKLHFVPKPRKQVDPSYKPGQFLSDVNVSPAEHQRRLRASQTQEPESSATWSKREQAQAKNEAESIRSGYSHSEDNQLSSLFVTDQTNQIDWVATREARQNMARRFQLRREGVRV